MKNTKKIGVLISFVLILLLAIGAASAADDANATADADLAAVDEVQTVDNTQITDEINAESTGAVDDAVDSGDNDDASDTEAISDSTGLQDISDDGGDEAAIRDNANPKNVLKAEIEPDEPLRAPDGSFSDLNTLLTNAQSGSTITLDRNYVYNPSTDNNYRNGILVNKTITINGNGFTIDGQGVARGLILGGYTTSNWAGALTYHGYTYGINNINFANLTTTSAAGAAIASHTYPNTVTISNCNFTNNRGGRGAISVSVQNPTIIIGPFVDTGSVTITGCLFEDNYASANSNGGGAIYSGISNDRSSITLRNNAFVNNTAAATTAQVIYYANDDYIDINYNWWGQNTWNNRFVANSNTNYMTPTYYYRATLTQTDENTVKLTLALNGGTAPSGSTLPARNATFSIASGAINPESGMFQGSIEADYASREDTTITAKVDNQTLTLNVPSTPREDIKELNITVANVTLPGQAEIVVDSDVNGTFNVTIGDTTKEVTLTNGHGTLTWDSLPEGQYFAVVTCIDNLFYNDKFAYTSFKVEKQNVTITVTATPDTIEYGETVTLSSALNDTAATAGTVTYYVDGTESGTSLDNLAVGTYEVIAKYTGDPNYNDAESAPITVTVTKPTPTINVTANPIIYGQDATITIGLKGLNDEGITALVKVTIAGKEYGVAVNNGEGTLTVSGLAAREEGYPISVEFAGNANYSSANNFSTKQVVYKADPIINVVPVEISYGEDAVVNITLELLNGQKLDGVTVIATVDGEDYPVTINNGVGTLTVSGLIVDEYDVMVRFPGNDNYSSAETTRYGIIVVNRAVVDVTVGNVVVTRPATGTIVLTASAPGEYIVKVGDDEYEVSVSLADVPVEIPISSMLAGTYDVKVTADETQNYEAVDETFAAAYIVNKGNLTVVAIPNATEMAIGEEIKLNHSLSAPEGAVLTGDVSYYIDGEKVESIFLGSKVGTYTFTVTYTGDPDFNDAVSDPVTITVNKFAPIFYVLPNHNTYGNNPYVSVFTVRNDTIFGGIPNITVLVTINNVTYAVVTTDFMGGVILELNDLDANEEGYSISAVTLETDEYASVSNNTEALKIYKVNTRLTIDSDRVSLDYGETSTLSHWITEGATGAVTYYLNGTAISGNVLSNLMPGNYTVTAKYEGDKNHKPADSENTLNITVKKINPRLSVSANNTVIKYLDSIKLLRIFDTPASGEVIWYVNGTAQMSNIIEDLKPGTYTVTAKYIEDEIYYGADSLNSLTITILKDDVNITVRSDRYTIPYGDSINLNSIIEPIEAWPWEDDVIYIVDGRETSSPAVSGLGVGTHTIIAKYVENDYFNEAYSEAITVNVIKATPVIEVLSDPVTYPNDAIVNFIVKGNNNVALPGVGLRVTINGVGYYVETGSDGKAVLTVKGLNVGEYTIGTVTVANDNYGVATNNSEKIVVNKGDLTITAGTSASSVAYGDEISFTNTITVPEGGVAAGTVKYYVDGNEIAGDSISTLAIGDHTVVAEYSGDANFNAANSTAVSFTVTKADPILIISANATEIQYLDNIKLSYTLTPDGATGSVVYYLDGTPVDGDVLKLLEPGTYTVTAKYEGNDNYNEVDSSNSLSITVGKCDVSIEVNSNNYTIEYGQAILLTASYDPFMATGHITYIVDGVEGDEYYFTDLSVGTHSIAARFNENVFYNGALSETKTITVTKATPEITVTANPIVYGQNATITIGLDGVNDEKITGVVKVTINGKIYDVAVSNGVGTLTVSGLAAREDGYPISVEFAGNENYKSANNYSAKQVVNKAQPAIEVTPVVISYGEDAVVNIALEVPNGEKLDGVTAYATVDGETYPVTIIDGVGTFTVSGLIVDKYDVIVEFLGNDNYSSAETTRYNSIVVNKAAVNVTVGNVVVIYPAGGKIVLTASAPGEYVVKVGDEEYEVTVDLAGVPVEVQVAESLPVGSYDVKVTADETQNHEAVDVSFEAAYIVNSGTITVSAQDLTVAYPNKGTIVIATDVAGNYTIKVGDKTYENVQLVDGANNFQVPDGFDVGTYDVKVSANIANYDAITDLSIASYTVTTANTTLVIEVSDFTYGDDASATITLKQGDTPLAGKMINITVDGIQRIETTNQSGVATFDLDLLYVGRYNIVAIFEGEGNYALAYNSSEFKVNKATPTLTVTANPITYGQDATITIGLDGVNGEKITGVVKVNINGKDYDVPVTNGAGTLTVSGLVVIDGGYPISAAFDGNDNYAAATNTKAKQVVNRANANIVVGHVEFEYGEEVVVPITVTGVNGEKLNGTVDAIAQDYYVVTIENGTGFIRPTGLSFGIYEVTAEFRGNENYNAAFIDDPLAIRITQGTINVTVANESVTYPNKGVISINASLPGTYTVTVGTKEYDVDIPSAGVPYQLELDEVFEVGTYDISVNRTESSNYHGVDAQNIATYTVNKGEVTVVAMPNATEITYGEEIKLNHSIIPPEGGDLNGMFTYLIDGEYAEIVVSGLSVGTHTFTVLYSGDPNFNDVESAPVTITVNKARPVVEVNDTYAEWNTSVDIPVKVTDADGNPLTGTVIVTVDWSANRVSQIVELDENGEGKATFRITEALGRLNVTANYTGNDSYESVKDTAVLIITESTKLTIEVTANEVTYGEETILTVTATDGRGNPVILGRTYVTIDGVTEEYVPINDQINVGRLPVGVTEITVRSGGGIYNWDEVTINATVNPAPVEIILSAENYTVDETGQLTIIVISEVEYFIGGTATVEIDGVIYKDNVPIEDNEGTLTLENIAVGEHVVKVTFHSPNYKETDNLTTFTVSKVAPVIEITAVDSTYPNPAVVGVKVTNDAGAPLAGIIVNVTVNGVDYAVVTNEVGAATLTIKGLDAGEYPIAAVSIANDNYASATYSGHDKVVIKKITPNVEIPNSVIVTYPDTAPMGIIVSVPGTYTVKVGTEEIPVVITETDTIVLFNITKVLDAGKYNVSVTADLGKNYEPVDTGTLATYTVRNATVTATAEDTVVEYPGRGEMYITVNAEGEYTIKIGDKTYTKTFYPGQNWLYVGDEFALGEYDVLVSASIPNYNAVEDQKIATYTVNPAEIKVYSDNITVYYPNYGIVTIYSNMDGDYIVSINGTEYPVVTVTNGKGYLYPHTWIPLGVHDVLVTADFGPNYKPLINTAIGTYTVLKSNIDLYVVPNVTSILYGDTISLDYEVNYIIDENCLTYLVDGKDIEGNIVSGLTVGTHTVAVRYSGDPGIEDTVSPPVTITVSKAAPVIEVTAINSTYPQAAGVTIAVKNDEGTLLSGVTVKVTVNGVDYAVETDNTGQAILTINGLAAGEYPITAVSIANDNYGSATNATEKLEVKAADLSIAVKANATDIKYGESISLDNVITAPEGTSAAGTVIYYVDGEAIDGNIVPAEQLTVGTHTVIAKYTDDPNFNDAESDPLSITVGKGIINISAEDVNVTYPNSDFLTITTDVEGDYTVYLGDYDIIDTHLYAGENRLIVDSGIFVGEYDIRVSANIDDYEELDYKLIGTYTVNQADVSLSISANATAITYGDTVSISYEIDPDTILEEDIIYYVDGTEYSSATLTDLTPGTHTVVAKYAGDQNYKAAESNVLTITVDKAKADVTVTADPVSYPNNATVVVNSNVPGTYTIRVGNKDYAVVVGDTGSGSVVIDQLAPGTYDIDLTADLGDNYELVAQVPAGSLTVLKATPTIDVVADENLKQGDAAGVNVTVMDGDNPVEGFVVIKVNGEEYIGELVEGKAEFVIPDLPANKYDVAAKYLETDCYTAVEYEGDACIDFITYYADFDIIIANGTYGDNLAITVENVTDSHGDSLDGHVLIIVYNEDNMIVGATDFDVTGGSGTDTIAAPCAGNLHATASFFTEYHDYESELKRVSFIVDKAVPTVNITYADGKFTVNLDGVNGEKLNETVYIIIDGNDPIEVITENGVNETAVSDLAVGDHSAYVVFRGNDNYLARSNFTSFNIPKANNATVEIIPTKDSFAYGEDVVINVTVKDGETGLSGVVNLTIGGVDYAVAITDGVGQVTVKGLENGTFPVTAKFIGNENYTEADAEGANVVVNASTEAVVIAEGSTVTYGEDSTIKIFALDGAGNDVDVSKVNVTINGETKEYDVVDGIITLDKLNAGNHTATINFTDGIHTVKPGTATLVVNPAEAQLTLTPSEGKVTIELKDGDKPLSGPATAIIDGVETPITIPETGILELPITEPGTHTVAVKFADDNHVPVTEVATVSNPKLTAAVSITVEPDSILQTESATVKVSLTDGDAKLDGIVIVTVGGVDYAVNVTAGEGTVTLEKLDPDTYTVKAKFIGNDLYNEAVAEDKTLKVTKVEKVDLSVTTEGNNVVIKLTDEAGNNVTGKVNVTVDGVTKEVDVNNGVAKVPVSSGNHNVTVTYLGDAVHGGTKVVNNIVNINPKVKRIGTVLTLSRTKVLTYNKYLDNKKDYCIIVTLKDVNGKALAGKKVQYSSHGKVHTRTTNAKGQIKFYVTHTPCGECNRAVSFVGDDKYNGSFIAAGIKVVRQKAKLTAPKKTFKASKKVKKLTATLKTTKGKAIGKRKIVFIVNKKKYTAKTNKKGKATVKVKLSRKKTYTVKVKFAGDKTYKKVSKKTSVKIK